MEKLKQRYLPKLDEGDHCSLFHADYLPENFVSLLETIILLAESVLAMLFLSGLVMHLFYSYYFESALFYILNTVLDQIFVVIHVQSGVTSNAIAALIVIFAHYSSRRYFEFVKYNLQILRHH